MNGLDEYGIDYHEDKGSLDVLENTHANQSVVLDPSPKGNFLISPYSSVNVFHF